MTTITAIATTSPVNTIVGDIIEESAAGVTIRHKKPRSSKFLITTIPEAQVHTVVRGDEGELNSEVLYFADRQELVSYEGELGEEEGRLTVTTEDGYVVVVYNGQVEIVAEDEEEAPKKGKKAAAKKAAPAKGKGKKAAEEEEEEDEEEEEEDEEEEEEDEEEEEEEEAPKKKGGKAAAKKAAPAKGKAKAAPAKGKGKAKKDEEDGW